MIKQGFEYSWKCKWPFIAVFQMVVACLFWAQPISADTQSVFGPQFFRGGNNSGVEHISFSITDTSASSCVLSVVDADAGQDTEPVPLADKVRIRLNSFPINGFFNTDGVFHTRVKLRSENQLSVKVHLSPGKGVKLGIRCKFDEEDKQILLDADDDVLVKQATSDTDAWDTYDPSEVSTNDNGVEIVRTKIGLMFHSDATAGEINALLIDLGASITTSLAKIAYLVVRIPDPGSLANLEALVAEIESNPIVGYVVYAEFPSVNELPDNIELLPDSVLNHHLAVRAPAAWNAREGVRSVPSILIADYFGDGLPTGLNNSQLNVGDYLENSISADPDGHGYGVLSVINAEFGGETDDWGQVTGIYPESAVIVAVELEGSSPLDYDIRILQAADNISGVLILNTSIGYECVVGFEDACVDENKARQDGARWITMVRDRGLEERMLHFTAAGNIEEDVPEANLARTGSIFSAAALYDDLVDVDGMSVPPLENTLVIGSATVLNDEPELAPISLCLSGFSFIGFQGKPHLAAIGQEIPSYKRSSDSSTGETVKILHGTSFATPQAAGLAAYMLSIKPDLDISTIKSILEDSARPTPVIIDDFDECSNWVEPAPTIDAYAALLALDNPDVLLGTATPNQAPVRLAILDEVVNEQFDEEDIMSFLNGIDEDFGVPLLEFGRFDLNGDATTGTKDTTAFDLGMQFPDPARLAVGLVIEESATTIDVEKVTDMNVLCFYAYSKLYQGTPQFLERNLSVAVCQDYEEFIVEVTLAEQLEPGVPTQISVLAGFKFADGEIVYPAGTQISLSFTGINIQDPPDNFTNSDGVYEFEFTPDEDFEQLTVFVTATATDNSEVVKTVSAIPPAGNGTIALSRFGYFLETTADCGDDFDRTSFEMDIFDISAISAGLSPLSDGLSSTAQNQGNQVRTSVGGSATFNFNASNAVTILNGQTTYASTTFAVAAMLNATASFIDNECEVPEAWVTYHYSFEVIDDSVAYTIAGEISASPYSSSSTVDPLASISLGTVSDNTYHAEVPAQGGAMTISQTGVLAPGAYSYDFRCTIDTSALDTAESNCDVTFSLQSAQQ